MFLKIDSITRRSPFPTHRFLWGSSPAFNRYYEGAKTASVRLLTSLYARIGYPVVSQYFAYAGCETPPAYPGLGQPVAQLLVSFRQGNSRLSHVPVKPSLHLPCSQTPNGSWHLPLSCFGCCSRGSNYENSISIKITRLNHTAFVIAVYASCQHLCRLRKTRFRLMANLYRTGLAPCWVSSKGFKEQFIPLSRAAHGAMLLFLLLKTCSIVNIYATCERCVKYFLYGIIPIVW